MITSTGGNILVSQADAIVIPVNCLGVAGAGLALQAKRKFPENYREYKKECLRKSLDIGKLLIWKDIREQKYIVNFPTKYVWWEDSKLDYIIEGISVLFEWAKESSIKSIAIPKLGCGLGKLNWEDVRKEIEKEAKDYLDINIILFERDPSGR